MKVVVTFDVDMTDYIHQRTLEEMEVSFELLKRCLADFPEVRTTWFLRIDRWMEAVFGRADYLFVEHRKLLVSPRLGYYPCAGLAISIAHCSARKVKTA